MPFKSFSLATNISLIIHLFVKKICISLITILAVSEMTTVILRYVYGVGFLKLHDIALYSFSCLVVFSIVYTFGLNEHVRVDVFREKQTQKTKQIVDCVSIVFFLIPFFSLILYYVWPDIIYSWSIYEGSRETGGLAGLFIVKSMVPAVCVLLIIQGLVVLFNRGLYLFTISEGGTLSAKKAQGETS